MAERFVQMVNLVEGVLPVDLQTGANDGDYVSLKEYHYCAVVFLSAIGTATDDPTLTLQQATDVAGGSVKDLDRFDRPRQTPAAPPLLPFSIPATSIIVEFLDARPRLGIPCDIGRPHT